jgi:hypothetical protein
VALLRQVVVVDDTVAQSDASRRLIEKIRVFVRNDLDEQERALFGALLAPGIAAAYKDASTEVEGFVLTDWGPASIPENLARTLREQGIRISGIDP